MEKTFKNDSGGKFTSEEVLEDMLKFYNEDREADYKIFIGSDSQRKKRKIIYITAIVIHRVGSYARFYYNKCVDSYQNYVDLSSRIFKETSDSIEATQFVEKSDVARYVGHDNIEVHVDAGNDGNSRKVLAGVIGYVTGMGYNCKTKPNAPAASYCADKFSK